MGGAAMGMSADHRLIVGAFDEGAAVHAHRTSDRTLRFKASIQDLVTGPAKHAKSCPPSAHRRAFTASVRREPEPA
jgi:quinol monooxygenase YgiN